MSERVRAPPAAYTNEEVGRILKRAAGLQREQGVPGATLTQSEIEQIAADAGIDPAQVRKAINELHQPEQSSVAKALLGAPTRVSIERIIPGELDPKHHDTLAQAIRRALQGGGPGLPSSVGRTFTYLVANRNAPVEISISAGAGNTVIRIDANQANFAGGIFGGIGGGFGASIGANVAWLLPFAAHTSVPVGIAAGAGVLGATWLGCRMIYSAIFNFQQRKLGNLADALEQQVKALL